VSRKTDSDFPVTEPFSTNIAPLFTGIAAMSVIELWITCIITEFADSNHPITSLMEIVGVLIEKYEDEHVPEWVVAFLHNSIRRVSFNNFNLNSLRG